MNLQRLFFAAVIVLSANAALAQDTNEDSHLVTISIPEVALLDLEVASGTTDITLAGTAPTEAGEAMTFEDADAKNTSIWMNYSSIVKGNSTRNVGVAITDGDVPAGLKLTVEAGVAADTGAGTMGGASTVVTLTTSPEDIITGVGSAYTGDGANKGHNLTYQLDYANDAETDYSGLDFDESDVLEITYTLSDI